MHIPDEIEKLYGFIEKQGTLVENERGLWGTLHNHEAVMSTWKESERDGGTLIEFHAFGCDDMGLWLGSDELAITQRVCIFAQSGGDGSMVGLWIDDDGEQHIVHLGSGSGSTLVCRLGKDPVDFIRLLAIGYDEICWPELFTHEPNHPDTSEGAPKVNPNQAFQKWVRETFNTTIPKRALDVIEHPSEMGDETSEDPFWNWVEQNAGE